MEGQQGTSGAGRRVHGRGRAMRMPTRKRDETVVPTRGLSELGERGLWTTEQDGEGSG